LEGIIENAAASMYDIVLKVLVQPIPLGVSHSRDLLFGYFRGQVIAGPCLMSMSNIGSLLLLIFSFGGGVREADTRKLF
jgi:hypothetical protein